MQRRTTNTIRQSPIFDEICKLYTENSKLGVRPLFRKVQEAEKSAGVKADDKISLSSFNRWLQKQKKRVAALENAAVEEIPYRQVAEQIQLNQLYKAVIDNALKVALNPEKMAEMRPKDALDAGRDVAKLVQAEQELYLQEGHHKETIDLKKEAMRAAYEPKSIIEVYPTGKGGPEDLREESSRD